MALKAAQVSEMQMHAQAESRETRNETEGALRQTKSRITTLEAELAVAKAESNNSKSLLVDSEKAVSLLRERIKTLESQLREMEGITRQMRRQQDVQVELDQVHVEKMKLRTLLEQKTAAVIKHQQEISSLQEQIDIYQEDFRTKSELVDNLEIRLRQRETELGTLKTELSDVKEVRGELQYRLKQLDGLATEKEKEMGRLATLLSTANNDIAIQKAKLDAAVGIKEDLLAASTENTRINILLQQVNVDLALKNQEIESLEQQIEQISSRPTTMANHMEELENLVDQQSNTLAGLHSALAQRDTLITHLESELSKSNQESSGELLVRERRIKELEEVIKRNATISMMPKGPAKNNAHLEAQIRDLEAEQVRYRAEVKLLTEEMREKDSRISQLESSRFSDQNASDARGRQYYPYNKYPDQAALKQEAAAVAAELSSLRVLVRQAGKDSSAFSSLRESEIGVRGATSGSSPMPKEMPGSLANNDDSIQASLATIKHEADALRAAVTTFYAESVGSDCAVQ